MLRIVATFCLLVLGCDGLQSNPLRRPASAVLPRVHPARAPPLVVLRAEDGPETPPPAAAPSPAPAPESSWLNPTPAPSGGGGMGMRPQDWAQPVAVFLGMFIVGSKLQEGWTPF